MTENLPTVQQKAVTLRNYLNDDSIRNQLAMAVPKWLTVDRLLRVVFSAAVKTPKILDCSRDSILRAVMICAQTGLEPILGRAHLVPYKGKVEFQPGYQGLVDLARRSGKIEDVYAMVVHTNDIFDIEYGTEKHLKHKPVLTGDPGPPIGAYAVWESDKGKRSFEYMTLKDIYKRREISQAYQFAKKNNRTDTPWIEWEDEMIKKTVVINSSKLQPASIEFMEAVEIDNTAAMGRQALSFDNPLLSGPDKTMPTLADFDRLAGGKISPLPDSTLDAFLSATATANSCTVDDIKTQAVDQFEGFWKSFELWRKQKADASMDGAGKEPTGRTLGSQPEVDKRIPCEFCETLCLPGKGMNKHKNNYCKKNPDGKAYIPLETQEAGTGQSPPPKEESLRGESTDIDALQAKFPNVHPGLFYSQAFEDLQTLLLSENHQTVWALRWGLREITDVKNLEKAVEATKAETKRRAENFQNHKTPDPGGEK